MLQSCKMAQKCSVLFATSRNSVSDVEERSGPHASARSATDEWLKGLEGRWHSRLYINESQTNGRVIHLPPPLTYLSSFGPFPALFRCSPIEWSCCKDKCDNIEPFLFYFHVRVHTIPVLSVKYEACGHFENKLRRNTWEEIEKKYCDLRLAGISARNVEKMWLDIE